MKIGIVGLGLIGGSLAKALKKSGVEVIGTDVDKSVEGFAKMAGTIDGSLEKSNMKECDGIFIALRPRDVISYLKENKGNFGKEQLVIDCAGTKKDVCEEGFIIAKESGFVFVGGHPMAGKQYGGYKYSRETLFQGASMIVVMPDELDIKLTESVKEIVKLAGFSKMTVASWEIHDQMIAFTSQLAHVVSNAYIKSPTAESHKGFSAGSYNDLTRVAYLDEDMWTELFLENRVNLLKEMKMLMGNLKQYEKALEENDENSLKILLREGKEAKLRVDGKSR